MAACDVLNERASLALTCYWSTLTFHSHSSDHMQTDEFGSWWDPDCFTFTYKMNNEKYELYDDQQIL